MTEPKLTESNHIALDNLRTELGSLSRYNSLIDLYLNTAYYNYAVAIADPDQDWKTHCSYAAQSTFAADVLVEKKFNIQLTKEQTIALETCFDIHLLSDTAIQEIDAAKHCIQSDAEYIAELKKKLAQKAKERIKTEEELKLHKQNKTTETIRERQIGEITVKLTSGERDQLNNDYADLTVEQITKEEFETRSGFSDELFHGVYALDTASMWTGKKVNIVYYSRDDEFFEISYIDANESENRLRYILNVVIDYSNAEQSEGMQAINQYGKDVFDVAKEIVGSGIGSNGIDVTCDKLNDGDIEVFDSELEFNQYIEGVIFDCVLIDCPEHLIRYINTEQLVEEHKSDCSYDELPDGRIVYFRD